DKTRILSIFFFFVAIGLAVYLVWSIRFSISEKERIATMENAIIDQLMMIREAEIAYASVNGRYTSDWDKLISFIDTGKFYLTERTEQVFQLSYGADSISVTIDTLGTVLVKDSLFTTKKWPGFDLNTVALVPGIEPETKFNLWADRITKGGVEVNVIEVVNPKPVDPDRDEKSDYNTRKPLRFGSRTSVTTAGNWE
ncbi:MAG: hypothetical protein AAGA66_16135, partial [Bacteroidota bacterium]